MQKDNEMGAVIACLDWDSIENAGFDPSKMTKAEFNLIRRRVERSIDDTWQAVVGNACAGVLPPLGS